MQIFMTGGAPGSSKVAILRAGAVVGEPGLFGDTPRMANVEAMTPCVVWALRGPRMEELSQRSPALALELLRAAGAVMAIAHARDARQAGADDLSAGTARRSREGPAPRRPSRLVRARAAPSRRARAASGSPERTSVSPSASTRASSGWSTAPVARRSDTTLTPSAREGELAERSMEAPARRRQRHAEEACLVELLDRVVVGAVEVAAQQAVARVALLLDDAQHAPHRHADERQRVAGKHQRALDRLGNDLGRAGGAQALEIASSMRAHDNRHLSARANAPRRRTFSADGVSW